MTTRNLTRKFVDARNSAKANRQLHGSSYDEGETARLQPSNSSDSSSWKSSSDKLPPLWVDSIEQAEADLTKIQSKSKKIFYNIKLNFFCSIACVMQIIVVLYCVVLCCSERSERFTH